MTALEDFAAGRALRLCASYERLPQADCVVPERCEERHCERCEECVHYDPAASLPLLGPEVILCDLCLDDLVEA